METQRHGNIETQRQGDLETLNRKRKPRRFSLIRLPFADRINGSLLSVRFLTKEQKEVLWRTCNLTSFSPCLTGPVDYPFASHHKGPGFKSTGGYLCKTGILLLALSRYIGDPDVIDRCGLV
jgi:hypothetical protein